MSISSILNQATSAIGATGIAASPNAQVEPTPAPPTTPPPSENLDGGGIFSDAFFLRMGFSFIVGLAVGYALKIAFKIALVVGGIILVALFSLQFAGLVDVNWGGVETQYNGWTDWVALRGGMLLDFMADNLSSAVSFLAGLALGLKL